MTEFIGFAALIVLVLVAGRAVQRRTEFLLTVADAIFALVWALEARSYKLWTKQVRDVPLSQRFAVREGRLIQFIDRLSGRLTRIGYRLEDRTLGKYHYNPYGSPATGLSAASYQDDEDDLLETAYMDDARYDY